MFVLCVFVGLLCLSVGRCACLCVLRVCVFAVLCVLVCSYVFVFAFLCVIVCDQVLLCVRCVCVFFVGC